MSSLKTLPYCRTDSYLHLQTNKLADKTLQDPTTTARLKSPRSGWLSKDKSGPLLSKSRRFTNNHRRLTLAFDAILLRFASAVRPIDTSFTQHRSILGGQAGRWLHVRKFLLQTLSHACPMSMSFGCKTPRIGAVDGRRTSFTGIRRSMSLFLPMPYSSERQPLRGTTDSTNRTRVMRRSTWESPPLLVGGSIFDQCLELSAHRTLIDDSLALGDRLKPQSVHAAPLYQYKMLLWVR